MNKYFLQISNNGFKITSEDDDNKITELKNQGYIELTADQSNMIFKFLDERSDYVAIESL